MEEMAVREPPLLAYDTAQVRQVLAREGDEYATVIRLGILGAGQQSNLAAARMSLERDLAPLEALPSISETGFTGSPFTREATLVATTRALTISLPVAAAACFLLLALWMRSFSYALVTTIPIGLVVSWLYAFMQVAGYSLNFVTATIAAVSIGIGIDYSIHMTQRFRQELAGNGDPCIARDGTQDAGCDSADGAANVDRTIYAALQVAGGGTGMALGGVGGLQHHRLLGVGVRADAAIRQLRNHFGGDGAYGRSSGAAGAAVHAGAGCQAAAGGWTIACLQAGVGGTWRDDCQVFAKGERGPLIAGPLSHSPAKECQLGNHPVEPVIRRRPV